jgi:hypothetical protein
VGKSPDSVLLRTPRPRSVYDGRVSVRSAFPWVLLAVVLVLDVAGVAWALQALGFTPYFMFVSALFVGTLRLTLWVVQDAITSRSASRGSGAPPPLAHR